MTAADPRKAYRQSAIQTESFADIFIQLYDQLSSLLYSAALAVEVRDIEKKTADLSRAFTILIHLQGAVDFARGGTVALNLNQFYKLVRKEISDGSVKLDAAVLRQAAGHVAELRSLWEQAQALSLQSATHAPPAASVQAPTGHSPSGSLTDSSIPDSASQARGWSA